MKDYLTNTALLSVITSIITGVITYKTTKNKNDADVSVKREELVDEHLKQILAGYQAEISNMRQEIQTLTEENKKLVNEVFELKTKIYELEERKND